MRAGIMLQVQIHGKKRRRDGDDPDPGQQRIDKRVCSAPVSLFDQNAHPHVLPLRPCEYQPRENAPPETIAPVASALPPHSTICRSPSDVDMNEDDCHTLDASFPAPLFHPRATPLDPRSLHTQLSGGRLPTPIQSNFYTGSLIRATSNVSSMDLKDTTNEAAPIPMQHSRDHPLPSPVHENDVDTPTTLTGSQLSRLSVSGEDSMDVDQGSQNSPIQVRKGRARSGAMVQTDKRKFSMGYRDDCEKCRARVPGHFSHFLAG